MRLRMFRKRWKFAMLRSIPSMRRMYTDVGTLFESRAYSSAEPYFLARQ